MRLEIDLATARRGASVRGDEIGGLIDCWFLSRHIPHQALRISRRRYLLSKGEQMTEWQPIETAPPFDPNRNGDSVLVWVKAEYAEIGHRSRFSGAWYSRAGRLINPTHWMPLPMPPKDRTFALCHLCLGAVGCSKENRCARNLL